MNEDTGNGIKTLRIPQCNGLTICVDYVEEYVYMPGFKEALAEALGSAINKPSKAGANAHNMDVIL